MLDIAEHAVHAVENPEALRGQAIDVVSDTITSAQAAAARLG